MIDVTSFSEFIIIKTGQFETFVNDTGDSFSLGDVLRTTALLRVLSAEKKIHWLTHRSAISLLPIQEHLSATEFNLDHFERLIRNSGALIINLERDSRFISILENKENIVGFVFKENQWMLQDYTKKTYLLKDWIEYCASNSANTWGAMLQKLLGLTSNLTIPLYKKPNVEIASDIGFNWHVGSKWPSKGIPPYLWEKLESDLRSRYKISWQRGLNSTHEYADWIASNRLIISADSLGVHLANAMSIPLIALFGSTDFKLHDAGPHSCYLSFDAPKPLYNCIPCWKSECFQKIHCSEYFDFSKIYSLLDNFLL